LNKSKRFFVDRKMKKANYSNNFIREDPNPLNPRARGTWRIVHILTIALQNIIIRSYKVPQMGDLGGKKVKRNRNYATIKYH
jgi:hypothetical protein